MAAILKTSNCHISATVRPIAATFCTAVHIAAEPYQQLKFRVLKDSRWWTLAILKIVETKLELVSLSCKCHYFKTANVKILSASFNHGS